MKIILLGAPGAGKGTQAEKISDKMGIPQISTGNIIREALKSGSELGEKAKSFMDKGLLVPDNVVIEIIRERLTLDDCAKGYILDGFPRTIAQAEALDEMGISIDAVLNIYVPDEKIVNRLSGRRVCADCSNTYHIADKKPAKEGVCDKCSGALIQRKDDSAETIAERLRVYHEQTEPLENFYNNKGILKTVEGQQNVEDTTRLTFEALENI